MQGGGLALKLLFAGYTKRIFINDFDPSIYAIWATILNNPMDFCRWLKGVKVDVDNWHKYKKMQDIASGLDDFELAKSTFFLNRTNISGVIKGG